MLNLYYFIIASVFFCCVFQCRYNSFFIDKLFLLVHGLILVGAEQLLCGLEPECRCLFASSQHSGYRRWTVFFFDKPVSNNYFNSIVMLIWAPWFFALWCIDWLQCQLCQLIFTFYLINDNHISKILTGTVGQQFCQFGYFFQNDF